MNSLSHSDALEQAIDHLMRTKLDLGLPEGPDSSLHDLVAIARELQYLPSPDFKSRLKIELEWEVAGRSITLGRSAHADTISQILPTLSGQSSGLYPVRGANMAASLAAHACLILLVFLGVFTVHHGPQILGLKIPRTKFDLSAYASAFGKGSGNNGGGGQHDRLNASKGALPMSSRVQIAPPVVQIQNQETKLLVRASVVAPPDLNLAHTGPMGDPLTTLMTPSDGPGFRGGIGDGDGGGVGSKSGTGLGSGTFGSGNGVSWPRAIFHPEPEFSEEARREHYQGVVSLLIVVGPDGRAHDIHILRALGMGLDEKAEEAVRTWRFEPGMKDGRPVPVLMEVDVDFRIH